MSHRCNKNFRSLLGLGLLFAAVRLPAPPLAEGHYDLGFDFEPSGPSVGWSAYVFDFGTKQRLDPAAHPFVLQPKAKLTASSGQAVPSALGVPSGQPYWVLPIGNTGSNGATARGLVFLGFRTEEIDPQVFAPEFGPSLVSLKLLSVTGSGPARGGKFGAYAFDLSGNPVFDYNTTDGITGSDQIPLVPIPAHNHANWAFTQPGRYAVTLQMTGTRSPELGGQTTSGQGTFHFWVPASGLAEPDQGVLAVGPGNGAVPTVHLRAASSTTAYGSALGAVSVTGLTTRLSFSTAPAASPANWDVLGLPESVLNGSTANTRFRLTAASAPGAFACREDNALAALLLSGSGRTGQGEVTVAGGNTFPSVWTFARSGIYRFTFVADTLDLSGLTIATSAPFEVTFLVGTSAEYDYATWADSWAAVAGLPGSALSDPTVDSDADGLNNRTEFLLAAHGFDPLLADAQKLPRPTLENGRFTLRYRRDTFRDWGSPAPVRLLAQSSANLLAWSSFDAKFPVSNSAWQDRLETFSGRIEERVIETESGFVRLKTVAP